MQYADKTRCFQHDLHPMIGSPTQRAVRGTVHAVLRNAATGEVEWETEQENTVTLGQLLFMMTQGKWQTDSTPGADMGLITLFNADRNPRIKHPFVLNLRNTQGLSAYASVLQPLTRNTTEDPNVIFISLSQRFAPPSIGQTRRIDHIALDNTQFSGNVSAGSSIRRVLAYVVLPTPCFQTDSQFLDVFYRVYLTDAYNAADLANLMVNPRFTTEHMLAALRMNSANRWNKDPSLSNAFDPNGGNSGFIGCYEQNFGGIWYEDQFMYENYSGSSPDMDPPKFTLTNSPTYAHEGVVTWDTLGLAQTVFPGQVMASMWARSNLGMAFWGQSLQRSTDFQNVFGHGVNNQIPFLDLDNLPTSGGSVTVAGTWTNPDFPQMFMVKFYSTGNVGVASYKVFVRRFARFNGNSMASFPLTLRTLPFQMRRTASPSELPSRLLTDRPPYGFDTPNIRFGTPSADSPTFYNTGMVRCGPTLLASYRSDGEGGNGVCIVSCGQNPNPKIYDTASTPALNVTNIYQMAGAGDQTSDSLLYIACGTQGLRKINPVANTITTLAGPSGAGITGGTCWAVDVQDDGTVWGLFDGCLAESSDGGTNWTIYKTDTGTQFAFTGISDNNWDKVKKIRVQPHGTEDRVALLRTAADSATYQFVWWSRAGSSGGTSDAVLGAALGTTDGPHCVDRVSAHNMIALDGLGDLWMVGHSAVMHLSLLRRVAFGSTTITSVKTDHNIKGVCMVRDSSDIKRPVYSQQNIGGGLVANMSTINSAGAVINNIYTAPNTSDKFFNHALLVHLGYGMFASCQAMLNTNAGVGSSSESTNNNYQRFVLFHAGQASGYFNAGSDYLVWEEYGWDGANWVEGNPNPKLTHAGAQALPYGATIAFANVSPSNNFVLNEFMTFAACKGILKDDATTLTVGRNNIFVVPIAQGVTDMSVTTVPASNEGVVTEEPVSLCHILPAFVNGDTTNRGGLVSSPGVIANLYSSSGLHQDGYGDVVASGNFKLSWKVPRAYDWGASIGINGVLIGLLPASNAYTNPSNINSCTFAFNYVLASSSSTYTIAVREGSTQRASTTVQPGGADGVTGTEYVLLEIERVGSVVTYKVNGVLQYTNNSASTADMRVNCHTSGIPEVLIAYDMKLTYTSNKRVVKLGSALNQTGFYDPDRMKCPYQAPGMSSLYSATINGSPAAVLLDGGFTAPAAGQVALLAGTGKLVFNSANAGQSFTMTYAQTKLPGSVVT